MAFEAPRIFTKPTITDGQGDDLTDEINWVGEITTPDTNAWHLSHLNSLANCNNGQFDQIYELTFNEF